MRSDYGIHFLYYAALKDPYHNVVLQILRFLKQLTDLLHRTHILPITPLDHAHLPDFI